MMKANSLGFAAFGFEFVAQGEVALLEVVQGTDTRGVVTSDTTTFVSRVCPADNPFAIANNDVSPWGISCLHAEFLNMKRLVIYAEMLTKGPTSVVAYEKLRFSYE